MRFCIAGLLTNLCSFARKAFDHDTQNLRHWAFCASVPSNYQSMNVSERSPYILLQASGGVPVVGQPQRTPSQTYLEVHLGDILEPFVQGGFPISRSETCECHFWQYGSGLGIHLPLQVSRGSFSSMQGAAVFLHELL